MSGALPRSRATPALSFARDVHAALPPAFSSELRASSSSVENDTSTTSAVASHARRRMAAATVLAVAAWPANALPLMAESAVQAGRSRSPSECAAHAALRVMDKVAMPAASVAERAAAVYSYTARAREGGGSMLTG